MDPQQQFIMQILTAQQEPDKPSASEQRLSDLSDRVFGGYGYDPDLPQFEGLTPALPPVGGGRHQVYPPSKDFGIDDLLKLYGRVPMPSDKDIDTAYLPED